MEEIISLNWLHEHLQDQDIVIVDCRFNLADPQEGWKAYLSGHIPGAVFFDLEKDLSGQVLEHGGRHPLPDVEELALKLGRAGIDATKTVIAYDDQGGQYAPRFWWLLRYLGHEQVAVLDEGYSAWCAQGLSTSSELPSPLKTTFVATPHDEMLEQVEAIEQGEVGLLIDSRAPDRYRGENETIDPKAGHIPGALNRFWMDNLRNQKWLSSNELRERFADLQAAASITVYCGSGVTACANVLAMTRAGLTNVKLYPGSWSDWISYNDHAIETAPSK
ncbi:thiosulfate sulfurtransferase [Pullulanibacillus camelliae]|uniref:Thiosulfate sulfurtransferase n=1 Tax=Pullulanibacillus camelliae TaxID=1707096 RepID=A0A8J2YKW6_9BACL|nr:sulfurtransferase [Pullulanibacillus camelliae]GGE50196.1 thiosulfate sulfurtransferase [Pullulanibacillus camelliae]